MNAPRPITIDRLEKEMIATSPIGTFFGVSQQTFDHVWGHLTDPAGDSVIYISMEIGADPDAYSPVRDRLENITDSHQIIDSRLQDFYHRYIHGPQNIPTYSGGLGILAGDTLKSYADCHLPVIAVSLLYRQGYFAQYVDSQLGQISQAVDWQPESTPGLYLLQDPGHPDRPLQIAVPFLNEYGQETVATAQVWMKMEVSCDLDFFVPEILLDFYRPETPSLIRNAASKLYNAESSMIKAIQRRMLGIGILPALRALGITSKTFHLNEQHGVIVAIQLIVDELTRILQHPHIERASDEQVFEAARIVSQRLVYTIHTPVEGRPRSLQQITVCRYQ